MAEVDWSALPIDALEAISNRLNFDPDRIRFRSVCTAWRSAAPKRPQLPWLIGHRKDEHRNHTLFSFFKFSSTGLEISPIPELPESPLFGGMPCRGSSHGWMALLDFAAPSVLLWNPVTKSKIHLPNLAHFPDVDKNSKYFKSGEREYAVSFFSTRDKEEEITVPLSFEETEFYLANQVVLSSDPALSADFVAMAVCGRRSRLAFYRAGDEAWTPVCCGRLGGWTKQLIFYKGRFYVAAGASVYVCDLGPNPKVEGIASLTEECSWMVGIIDESHLVESDGHLLFVIASYPGFLTKKGYRIEVFRLEWGEKVKLVKVESLGDRALFLGLSHAFSLNATLVPGCRANSIYYTEIYYAEEDDLAKHFRICDFSDGSNLNVNVPRDDADSYPDWKPCGWLTPSLLL